MTLAKAKARANETFIVHASLTIITYDCQNIFIVHATGLCVEGRKGKNGLLGAKKMFFSILIFIVTRVTRRLEENLPKFCEE